jgi:hypothetical protein
VSTIRRRKAKPRRNEMTDTEMIGWWPSDDDDVDRAVWEANRHRWPATNPGTAPEAFWRFEACVPADLRGEGGGSVVNTPEVRAAFDRFDETRRVWLAERDWRNLLDE